MWESLTLLGLAALPLVGPAAVRRPENLVNELVHESKPESYERSESYEARSAESYERSESYEVRSAESYEAA